MVTIMVVDDTPSVCKMITKFFSLECPSWKVCSFIDPIEAVTEYSKIEPDLVIVDIMMPNLSGYEFLDAIQWDPSVGPPVIVYTAYHDSEAAIAKIQARGVDIILGKPTSLRKIKEHILACLGEKK